MGYTLGQKIVREIRSNLDLQRVDRADHATKGDGSAPTGEMPAVVKAATGGSRPDSGPSPSDVN